MADKLLIRDVPEQIYSWIQAERERSLLTQNQVVLNILRDAFDASKQLPLFQTTRRIDIVSGSLPFSFIDIFAGIGGMRYGLERVGGRCVWSCEWDRYAQRTYREWFGEVPHGDVRNVDIDSIPTHDVLAAGFPCQPFSIAGVSKKNSLGREHGFKDETQGTLFFHLATIIEKKRPPVLLLENVKNLKSHDRGRTWEVIKGVLEDLEYIIFDKVIDAAGWVPQHRERVFIVGFDRHRFGNHVQFDFPKSPGKQQRTLAEILEDNPDPKYTLSDHLWGYLQKYAERHREKGNGFGFGIGDPDGVTRTLSARYYKDGSEILIAQKRQNPRRLTPRECARLMGFPDRKIVVSDTQAYRQFGNAVVPLVVEAIGLEITRVIAKQLERAGATLANTNGNGNGHRAYREAGE
jgi:DNA (cytosine-5)-methyltransferase 1